MADAAWVPNDPAYINGSQWGFNKIGLQQAWDLTRGSSTVKVAILDTGVDLNHSDLSGQLLAGYNALNGGSAQDDNGHGTHVAGIVAAVTNNGIGVAGVAGGVKLIPVKVLGADGNGTMEDVAAGIRWAADTGAQVMVISFNAGSGSRVLEDAINYAAGRGVLMVAGTGDDYAGPVGYPASYDPVIGVAATNQKDLPADFANIGPGVDLAAPGVGIYSTLWSGRSTYGSLSGTSLAAAHVAGLAALIFSVHPDWTSEQVLARLQETARDFGAPGWDAEYGYGRIYAYRAVSGQIPSGDGWENNDNYPSAPLITEGAAINPKITSSNDIDWFKLNLISTRVRLILNLQPPAGLDMAIKVYDANQNLLATVNDAGPGGAESKIINQIFLAGNYYLKVYETGGGSAVAAYTLAAGFEGDTGELNNNPVLATALGSSRTVSSTIFPNYDADWYRISLPQNGYLELNVIPPAGMNAVMVLTDTNMNRQALFNAGLDGVAEGGTLSLPAGDYYLRISDYSNRYFASLPYTVTANFTADQAGETPSAPEETLQVAAGAGNYTVLEGAVGLSIPEGAFATPAHITVRRADRQALTRLPSGFTVMGDIYDFSADQQFEQPITISLRFNPVNYIIPDTVAIFYYNPTVPMARWPTWLTSWDQSGSSYIYLPTALPATGLPPGRKPCGIMTPGPGMILPTVKR